MQYNEMPRRTAPPEQCDEGGYVVAVQAMMGMVRDGTLQLDHDWA